MRTYAAVFFLLSAHAANSQTQPSNVLSARIENITAVPDKASIHVNVRNTGQRPITAFSVDFYQRDPNGQRIPCGGRGIDMLDWSDPMPGQGIYVHMRRNWIPPNGALVLDVFPRCAGHAELNFIMFDDGTGEGDSQQIESTLRRRQQARNERLRWMTRLTGLRNAPDLKTSAQSLYQDLVDATRAAEIIPDNASRQGMAKPVREELQRLALEITQWAAHSQTVEKNEFLEWRITDLEQRTARLIRGSGTTEVSPY